MVDIMSGVQQMYDEIGSHFSRTRQKTYGNGESSNWPITDKYLSKLKSGQKVLDLGCGNGKLISGLPKGVGYLGTDFSKTLLSEAKQLHPAYEFRYGNIASPDHWEGLDQYEAIFCVATLHHIPKKSQQLFVLREARKHIKIGGFLYLTVWNLWQEKFLQYHVDDHVEVPYNRKWKRFCVAFDIQSLSDVVTEAGFKIQELFYADREGKQSSIMTGQNLVCVAKV